MWVKREKLGITKATYLATLCGKLVVGTLAVAAENEETELIPLTFSSTVRVEFHVIAQQSFPETNLSYNFKVFGFPIPYM